MKKKKIVSLTILGSLFLTAFLAGSWLGEKKADAQPSCVNFAVSSCDVDSCNACADSYTSKLNLGNGWTEIDTVEGIPPWRLGLCYR